MDLNELFRRHQLALMAFLEDQSPAARLAAARVADDYAVKIREKGPSQTRNRIVLSSRTLLAFSSDQI